jgi:hypothetical protein
MKRPKNNRGNYGLLLWHCDAIGMIHTCMLRGAAWQGARRINIACPML